MRAFLKGFACAGRGLATAIKEERNMRFHLCAAVYVLVFSLFYSFSVTEYCLLFLFIFLVLAMETLNSAIERLVDGLSPAHSQTAGLVKDIAAGAVLLVCVGATACGFLLFWDVAAFAAIFRWFATRPLMLFLLCVSLVGGGLLVFLPGGNSSGRPGG